MGSQLLESPKIYLDTCHLINIAKVRKGDDSVLENRRVAYSLIDEYIRNWHFGLIFNPSAVIEWVDGNATLDTALEIADVVDSATLQYELELDSLIYLSEILVELRRIDHSLTLPEFEIMHVRDYNRSVKRALGVLANDFPEIFDEGQLLEASERLPREIPFDTARGHAQRAREFRRNNPWVVQERVDGWIAALNQDFSTFANRKRITIQTRDFVEWMKRYLKVDRILIKVNPMIDVDGLLNKVESARCPAVDLFFKVREKRISAGNPGKNNDVDDWLYLPVVPYADLVLTERNLRSFIHQADPSLAAKATHDPNRAIEILKKWASCA